MRRKKRRSVGADDIGEFQGHARRLRADYEGSWSSGLTVDWIARLETCR